MGDTRLEPLVLSDAERRDSPEMSLTEPATMTTPNTNARMAWASTVRRIWGSRSVVSDTW